MNLRILLFILCAITSHSVSAKSSQVWNRECLEQFKNNRNLQADVITKLCAGRASNLFAFNVMNLEESPQCVKPIVLLGENHDQNELEMKSELEVAELLSVRAVEGVPTEEYDSIKKGPGLSTAGNRNKLTARFLSWVRNDGSSITRIKDRGFSVGVKPRINGRDPKYLDDPYDASLTSAQWANYIRNISSGETCSYSEMSRKSPEELKKYFTTSDKFLEIFNSFVGKPGFPPVAFDLETNPDDRIDTSKFDCTDYDSPPCRTYVHTARNERMARNIKKIQTGLPCGTPLLVVVGSCHIGPLSKRLSNEGYKTTAGTLDPDPYLKCGRDPSYPND